MEIRSEKSKIMVSPKKVDIYMSVWKEWGENLLQYHCSTFNEEVTSRKDEPLDKDKDNTVYCHIASTWNLDVVAYIIHT